MSINGKRLNSTKVDLINTWMNDLYDSIPYLYEALMDDEIDDVDEICKSFSKKIININKNRFKLNEI
jgi:hypothetical protein